MCMKFYMPSCNGSNQKLAKLNKSYIFFHNVITIHYFRALKHEVLVVIQSLKVERKEISWLYEQVTNSEKAIYSTEVLEI
jgi:hypothetical protein